MELTIGSNIKRLRKEKNLTQEQLAELVGVSFQAISKWENNIGYPDITLLPALSSVLDASVDTIMGVDRSQAEIERLLLEIAETSKSGRLREAYEMGKEALCRFPSNDLLLFAVSSFAFALSVTADEEEKGRLIDEIRTMTDRILAYSQSDELKTRARWTLCQTYIHAKDKKSAAEVGWGLPDITACRQYLLASCLEGEEKKQFMEKTMYLVTVLFTSFVRQSSPEPIPDHPVFSRTDRKTTENLIKVWDIAFSLMSDGIRVKRQNVTYMNLHLSAAERAVEESDREAALSHLSEAAECAVTVDTADQLPLEVVSSNNAIKQLLHLRNDFRLTQEEVLAHNLSYTLLHGFLPSASFDGLREEADFTAIAQRLAETAV